MATKILSATRDFVFKYVLGSDPNKPVLRKFLGDHLTFDAGDELDTFEITNPFTLKDYEDDKYGILDIKVKTKNGKHINVEMQVVLTESYSKRELFYESRLIIDQLGGSDDYSLIKPVIRISILAENKYPDDIYHHRFIMYDTNARIAMDDENLIERHYLELPKVDLIEKDSDQWVWGKILSSDSEEELNMLAQINPVYAQAVDSIKHCSTDPKLRELALSIEMRHRDEVTRRNDAVRKAVANERAAREKAEAENAAQAAKLAEYERRFGKLD